jgi:hypothetical protein
MFRDLKFCHSVVSEDLCFVGCDVLSAFGCVVPNVSKELSASVFKTSGPTWHMKKKILHCFETSGSTHATTECHMPEDINPYAVSSLKRQSVWKTNGSLLRAEINTHNYTYVCCSKFLKLNHVFGLLHLHRSKQIKRTAYSPKFVPLDWQTF